MKKSKLLISGVILLGTSIALTSLGGNKTVKASVNEGEFNTLTRQWTDACYLLGTGTDYAKQVGSAYPNRLFTSQGEAYDTLSPFAYTDPTLIQTQAGFTATGQSITLDGSPIITDSKTVVSGSEQLTNNTSGTLNMQSNSTEVTITNSVDVNTTSSYDLGITDKVTVGIPTTLSNETTVSFTYDLSNSNTQSTSTSESITLPSQTVPVKPGHTVEVDYVMDLSKGTGNLNINGELSGNSVAYLTWFNPDQQYVAWDWMPLGKMLDVFEYPVANGFTKVSDDTVSHKGGSAQYSTTYHTDMQLEVKDLTEGTTTLYDLDSSNLISK